MTPARPAPPGGLTIQVFVPGVLKSRLNGSGSRAHWSKISEDARWWRIRTRLYWLAAGGPTREGPATVTFTAYVGRLWDSDNLPAALKSVRDEAVTHMLGTDDGPRCGHEFNYLQEVRPMGERGVLITVTPAGRGGPATP